MVNPVAVLNEITIQMQVTIGCKGILDYRQQQFDYKFSDVVVQGDKDVAYIIQITLAGS